MSGLSPEDFARAGEAPLFADLDRADLAALLEGAQARAYPEGGPLFAQGDAADRFFVVLAGQVHLFALTEAGDQSVIEMVQPVATFAEAAIFLSSRYPLHCATAPGTRLVHIPAAPFLRRLSENRILRSRLLTGLVRWQIRLWREVAELKRRSPAQRLAAALLALAVPDDPGHDPESGCARLRLPVAKSLLASRIGITPESLSRALARLKSVGVESRGRAVILNDPQALRRFLHG